MRDCHEGLRLEERGGCLAAAAAGLLTSIADFGRILGDPARAQRICGGDMFLSCCRQRPLP